MSERHHAPGSHELQPIHVEHEARHEHHLRSEVHDHRQEESHRPSIEELTARVEAQAISGKETVPSHAHEQNHHPVLINKQLKDAAYHRSLLRVQKRLSPTSRALSHIVHSSALDKPSELASKTIARPSGMLGGTFFAMLGTLGLYWLTQKYGYEYNYLLAIVLFFGGAIIGLTIEGIIKLLKGSN